jgi:mannose-6-phosphate isomerase-like protein (cupin superfamily)
MVTLPPGESGDLHAHKREQEVWFVIAGTGRLKIGDDEVELVPDTLVVAPPGTQHQIMNSGKEPLRALFMYSPAGPETSFLPSG